MGFMGSLFGAGGGSQAKSAFKNYQGGVNSANDLSDWTTTQGKATTQTGLNTLDTAKQYWTGILSGSRPAQMAAAAPEINAANEADAAQRAKESAFGTSRGGGTNAAAQNAETQRMTNVNNSLFGARATAAQQTADIGNKQMEAGLKSLGISDDMIKSIISGSGEIYGDAAKANQNMLNNIGSAIGSLFL
jgi:hypothetical protein